MALAIYYKKPRLPKGWNLADERRQIEKGIYRLRMKLIRTAKDQLGPCSLRIRCDRPVLKANLHRPSRVSEGRYLISMAPYSIDHAGAVTVEIGGIDPGDQFFIEGHLDSDGPLKIQRVDYRLEEICEQPGDG